MRPLSAVVLAFAAALASAQTRPPDFVLDLLRRAPVRAVTSSSTGAVPGGVIGGGVNTDAQLRVTLVSVDRTSFQTGDSVVYELAFENVGKTRIVLPWSPDVDPSPQLKRESDPSYRYAAINLDATSLDGSRVLARLQPQPLKGDSDTPMSLQQLQPGQVALIRAQGSWRATNRELLAVLNESNGHVRLTGVVHLITDNIVARSVNHVEVVIVRGQ